MTPLIHPAAAALSVYRIITSTRSCPLFTAGSASASGRASATEPVRQRQALRGLVVLIGERPRDHQRAAPAITFSCSSFERRAAVVSIRPVGDRFQRRMLASYADRGEAMAVQALLAAHGIHSTIEDLAQLPDHLVSAYKRSVALYVYEEEAERAATLLATLAAPENTVDEEALAAEAEAAPDAVEGFAKEFAGSSRERVEGAAPIHPTGSRASVVVGILLLAGALAAFLVFQRRDGASKASAPPHLDAQGVPDNPELAAALEAYDREPSQAHLRGLLASFERSFLLLATGDETAPASPGWQVAPQDTRVKFRTTRGPRGEILLLAFTDLAHLKRRFPQGSQYIALQARDMMAMVMARPPSVDEDEGALILDIGPGDEPGTILPRRYFADVVGRGR